MTKFVADAHAFSTLALVGLIWVVQIVIYPGFAKIESEFASYHADYTRRITYVVAPLMLAELATSIALVASPPAGISRGLLVAGPGLCILLWLSTAFLQVPIHNRLQNGHDLAGIQRLVATNWLRTVLWSARGLLALWILSRIRENVSG